MRGTRWGNQERGDRLEIILEGVRWASQVPMGALVCLEEASWFRLNFEFRQAARSS